MKNSAKFLLVVFVAAGVYAYTTTHKSAPTPTITPIDTPTQPIPIPPTSPPDNATPIPQPPTYQPATNQPAVANRIDGGGANPSTPKPPIDNDDPLPSDTHNDKPSPGNPSPRPIAPQPAVTSAAPQPPAIRASREGANNGCKDGQLIFNLLNFEFVCPKTPDTPLDIKAADVIKIDSDGVEAWVEEKDKNNQDKGKKKKQKFHFHIEGKTSQQVGEMFQNWKNRAQRMSALPN